MGLFLVDQTGGVNRRKILVGTVSDPKRPLAAESRHPIYGGSGVLPPRNSKHDLAHSGDVKFI